MNYDSLLDQIKAYANREDAFFVSAIPDFINQGMNRIYYQAKDLGFESTLSAPLVSNQIILPLDWRETVSLSIINNATSEFILLEPRSYEFTLLMSKGGAGVPEFYANVNYKDAQNNYSKALQISAPLADYANWTYLLVYLSLPVFSSTAPTNFLTERYPNLLLYSCLMETIPYLKDDERIAIIKEFYQEALASVNNNAKKIKTDRTLNRDVN